ncbi:MAG TPA: aminoglycoside phosphotransferase family protein [Actinotalea sp.]
MPPTSAVPSTPMHDGEVYTDTALVAALLAEQIPHLAGLPIRPVLSTGTVNAIYRVGDALYARLPRLAAWAQDLENECLWLPRLASHLSLAIPEPVATGRPTSAYPFAWAVYRWIPGEPYADDRVDDERQAGADLARFVHELRGLDPAVGSRPAGRRPLRELDEVTREAIAASGHAIDPARALAAWDRAPDAPAWDRRPVWIHADLLRPNVLVSEGRLRAVIDFGGVGVGDPAADVIPAWAVFGPSGRAAFRASLDVDDGTWERARGYALHQAAMIIPYYRETNPAFAALAVRTVEQLLGPD